MKGKVDIVVVCTSHTHTHTVTHSQLQKIEPCQCSTPTISEMICAYSVYECENTLGGVILGTTVTDHGTGVTCTIS